MYDADEFKVGAMRTRRRPSLYDRETCIAMSE